MNIVYLHSHDTGRYIQPYGYAMPTPNLMKLAEQGTLFRHAYCAGPTCSPSRSALLTGQWAHESGMLGLAHRGFKLHDASRHLASVLRGSSFDTALSGIQHESTQPLELGYDRVLDKEQEALAEAPEAIRSSRDDLAAWAAARYVRDPKRKTRPFFLSVGFWNTHRKFPQPDSDVRAEYLMPPHPMYDCDANRRDMAGYVTSARILDRAVGTVLSALDEAGLANDTVVVYTTDHGIAFPHMKCQLYDTGIGVSLIMRAPGMAASGKALDALVSHVDVYPTLCELAGVAKPDWLRGASLTPLLRAESEAVREELFSEVTYHAAYEPQRCVRTDRYKLIRRYDLHDRHVPSNIDDGPSKSFLVENGLLNVVKAKELLFDLYLDPVERENVANDPHYSDVYEDLSGRLSRWMQATNDPLLQAAGGQVPKPEGAVANKVDSLSAASTDYE